MSIWDERYRKGGTSGAGSQGRLAQFKAGIVSLIVAENNVSSIVDYGCGDGVVASLFDLPEGCTYTGYDPSPYAKVLREDSKFTTDPWDVPPADLALSLDVILYLTKDKDYLDYLTLLSRHPLILIYSPCTDEPPIPCAPHVRFRDFRKELGTPSLIIPNPYPFQGDYQNESFSNFYLFKSKHHEPI